jgi:transcription termination/antitermination protein NusA
MRREGEMAEQRSRKSVDLSESSIYGGQEARGKDVVSDATLNRLETLTGGAEVPMSAAKDPQLADRLDELDAGTEEEIDALKMNLLQEDELPDDIDGTGRVVDEVAEERIAALTETEPLQDARGARSVEAGNDDTSEEIRRHHPGMQIVDADALSEGNIEETRDEELGDRNVA